MDWHDVFTHILQGCFSGTGASYDCPSTREGYGQNWPLLNHNKTREIRNLFTYFWWYTVNLSAFAQLLIHNKTKHNKMWRCEPYKYFLWYIVNVLSCPEGTSRDDSVLLVVSKQSLTLPPNFAERKKNAHPYSLALWPSDVAAGSALKSLWVIKCLYDIEVSSMNHGGPFVHLSSWGKEICQISAHNFFCHWSC